MDDRAAIRLSMKHPVATSAWLVADYAIGALIRLQETVEAHVRKEVPAMERVAVEPGEYVPKSETMRRLMGLD